MDLLYIFFVKQKFKKFSMIFGLVIDRPAVASHAAKDKRGEEPGDLGLRRGEPRRVAVAPDEVRLLERGSAHALALEGTGMKYICPPTTPALMNDTAPSDSRVKKKKKKKKQRSWIRQHRQFVSGLAFDFF
jgi:hypothetical protein